MRVLLGLHHYPPGSIAGTELIALRLVRALRARGHETAVFAGEPIGRDAAPGDRFVEDRFEDVRVVRFLHRHERTPDAPSRMRNEYAQPLATERFGRLIDEWRPDVVHFLHLGRIGAGCIDAAAERRRPIFWTVTDFWPICPTAQLLLPDGSICPGPDAGAANCMRHLAAIAGGPLGRSAAAMPKAVLGAAASLGRLPILGTIGPLADLAALADRREFLRSRAARCTRIFAPSETVERALRSAGFDERRIERLPYGIDVARAPRALRDPTDERPLRVVFLGTFVEHKGPHIVIDAVRSLPASTPITLELFGDPRHFPAYVRALEERCGGDRRIAIKGLIAPDDVAAMLAERDLLVCPSLWIENTPLVLSESMAAGTPVLASDLPGLSESVDHGVNGELFRAGDASALAALLARCASDRGLVARWSGACRRPFSIDEHAERVLSAYRDALGAVTTA
jgi:glycosyltransferase involved in cell wall biosynthesis